MKFSVKVQDSQPSSIRQQNPAETRRRWPPLLFRAKIPISIFNRPFLTGFSTTTHHQPSSDFSLFFATNFSSGPTLKFAYAAISSSSTTSATASPLTLTLKSGLGLYGSPKNSPFTISANCSFYPHGPHSTPTFSLILKPQLKPQLGSFSLRAPSSSNPKGISVLARTEIPVSKRVLMSCRWGVNFPEDLGRQTPPHLTLNKIEIESVDEVKEKKKKKKRELDTLQREIREMKLKLGKKKKKNAGGDNGKKEFKKDVSNGNRAGVESELQSGFFSP